MVIINKPNAAGHQCHTKVFLYPLSHHNQQCLNLYSHPFSCVCAQLLSCVQLFCDPMDSSSPGSSVCGISQARILEWIAISSLRRSSQPRDWTCISHDSCIGRWILYHLGSPASTHIHLILFI